MKLLNYLLDCHRFFVRESCSYAGGWNWRFPTQYLRAYVRFMASSIRDFFNT